MKKVLSYLVITVFVASTAMTGCKKENEDVVENPEIEVEKPEIEEKIDDVYIVDISEETDWDLMIVGIGGQSVFLNINENTEMPTQLFCKPDKKSNAGFSVFFKENGLPETMVVDGYISYFGNFRNTLFDFALIHPDNSIEYFYDIESGIDWDEYLESSIMTRFLGINFKKVISATVNIVKVAVKVAVAAPLFMNPITVPAGIALVISATPDLIRFADDLYGSVGIESPPFVSEIVDKADKIGTVLNCATGNLKDCVEGIAGIFKNEAINNFEYKETKEYEINQAEAVINGSAAIDKITAKVVNSSELSGNIKTVKFVVWSKWPDLDYVDYMDSVDYVLATAEFKDGGFTLNLPKEVPSKYLELATQKWDWLGGNINNKNAKIFYQDRMGQIWGYNSNDKMIASFSCRDVDYNFVDYIYADSDVNITGKKIYIFEWEYETRIVSLFLKKGWNVVYHVGDGLYQEIRSSPIINAEWKGWEFDE